jgi:hypothetical protein
MLFTYTEKYIITMKSHFLLVKALYPGSHFVVYDCKMAIYTTLVSIILYDYNIYGNLIYF